MKLIQDAQLRSLIQQNLLVLDVKDPSKQIKGCSVDLTIGAIFIPGLDAGKPGSVNHPRRELSLAQGQTAVIRTGETVSLPPNHAGIAFPVSRVSLQGLLMTNPGHIDPGYSGALHVTVINMAKDPYFLKEGDRLLRTLFMELDDPPPQAYGPVRDPIDAELLDKLSYDFMSLDRRAASAVKEVVNKAEFRARIWQIVIPAGAALVGIALTWLATSQRLEDKISQIEARLPAKIEERMIKVETLVPVVSRLESLELKRLRDIDERLTRLEERRSSK